MAWGSVVDVHASHPSCVARSIKTKLTFFPHPTHQYTNTYEGSQLNDATHNCQGLFPNIVTPSLHKPTIVCSICEPLQFMGPGGLGNGVGFLDLRSLIGSDLEVWGGPLDQKSLLNRDRGEVLTGLLPSVLKPRRGQWSPQLYFRPSLPSRGVLHHGLHAAPYPPTNPWPCAEPLSWCLSWPRSLSFLHPSWLLSTPLPGQLLAHL